MKQDHSFVTGRLKSVRYALAGAWKLLTTEHSIMVQATLGVALTIAGFFFHITKEEWLAQTFAIGLVLSVEGVNTAVEKIADFIHPDYHARIGFIKDIGAGAVFFAAMAALAVCGIIYVPYLMAS